MCFSAAASFTAGAALLGIGAATLRAARQPRERPFAAIPLLFGIQQGIEGVLWLAFGWDTPGLVAVLTQAYSVFSHVLWPVYVPLAAWALEPRAPRRGALAVVSVGGIAVGAYLLYNMFANPIVARPVGQHIDYDSPHFYVAIVMTLYLTATTASMLLSSHRVMKLFGALTLTGAVVAYLFYARWFISVWCFFAAALSVVVYLHFAAKRVLGTPVGDPG
ncbi:MAG: DUF6629 family protein [Pseudomonadota bacterium]|nr:hypothetical protein [Nevskiales bacterium]MEC9363547.1 DUF6629 family protein [Pseudomonadota bacterium]